MTDIAADSLGHIEMIGLLSPVGCVFTISFGEQYAIEAKTPSARVFLNNKVP